MNTKQNEIDYVDRLDLNEKKWLYTKPFGDFNIRESFLRIRDFSYIIELLKIDDKTDLNILDLGCGSGWTSIFLAKLGFKVTGVDISPAMIKIAKERVREENVKVDFVAQDIEKVDFKDKFDRVLIYDALHHCPNEKKVLQNAYRSLKKGGQVLIVEPNAKHGQDEDAQKIAQRFGVLEKGYSPKYLKIELQRIGFKNITRFHCNYGINQPMPGGVKSFFIQVARLIVTRLIFAHYHSQVWMTAEK